MIVSAAQPYFCPYPGYFARAAASDIFVILDTVQFPRGPTWITRNRLKNDQGTLWLGIPVKRKGLGLQKISEVRLCPQAGMPEKHLESVIQAYRHAPWLDEHLDFFQGLFSSGHETILRMNMLVIDYVMKWLQADTRIVLLSGLGIEGRGSRLLADICKSLSASQYLAQNSTCYLDELVFSESGIELARFKPPVLIYPQLWGDFIPNLSIFDLMLNCGDKGREMVKRIQDLTGPRNRAAPAE
jgi:hypothetical protein